MALQVWLPLNGDLKNKGCDSDYDVPSTNYAVWANDGKIGNKSLYATTTTSGVLGYSKTLTNDHSYSICAWLKNSDETTGSRYIIWTGSDSGSVGFGMRLAYSTPSVVQCLMFGYTIEVTIGYNSWHHICMVIDYEHLSFSVYLDGTFVDKKTYAINTVSNYGVNIGWLRPSYYPFKGQINDVRIYDHCLSPAEVKEISRGLILHYKLDDPYIGLKFYEYLEKSSTAGTKDYIDTGINNYSVESIRCVCEASINDTGDSAFFGTRGNYYVFYKLSDNYFWPQSKATTMNNTTLSIDTRYIIDYNKGHFTVTDKNGLLYQEATRTSTTLNTSNLYIFNFNPTDSRTAQAKIYYFKIYNNDVLLRDFVPCSYNGEPGFWDKVECKFYGNKGSGTFTLGTEVSLTTIVTDSSGYGNHGTINGTLKITSDVVKYKNCVSFDSSRIISDDINLNGSEPFSISCRMKITTSKTYQPVFWLGNGTTANGICLHGSSSNRLEGGDGTAKFDNTGIVNAQDIWKHIVIIWDKSSVKRYTDVVLTQTIAYNIGFGSTLSKLYVGYFWGGYFAGNISDVRIYATALSEEDVRQLYEVSTKVDNKGNIECFEIEESSTNPEITKTGIVKAKNCIETFDYLYLPAGAYVNTDVAYTYNETCTADTVMRYASGGSGRDLMGYSPSGGGYWGVTANGAWEPHGTFSYTDSDITKVNRIHYSFSSERDAGTYRIGILSGSYSVRDKYIYRVTLYHEGTLVRDMYPAKHGSAFGLVDIVTNVFYPSVGSNVTVGNDNSEYRAKIRNNYIEVNEFIEV